MAFDNDDVLEEEDDEDLQKDPVSTMDMQVGESSNFFGPEIDRVSRNTFYRFSESAPLAILPNFPPLSTK